MIPEPQKTYVLELLKALGPAAEDFVIAGAQAIKFMLKESRGTKDIDFVIDVAQLKERSPGLRAMLAELEYEVVTGSNNFQFEKPIPDSKEVMRIEFMAPEEFKREKDFRVDIDEGIHARFCTGGTIAIAESSMHQISGTVPDGSKFTGSVRVTKSHALVMLKLLALDDRYRNVRGPAHSEHDRQEAGTHAADIVAVVSAQSSPRQFRENFLNQFKNDRALGIRVVKVLNGYFREDTSPGLLLYEEAVLANQPVERAARQRVSEEIARAHQMIVEVMPAPEFYALLAAIDDCSNKESNRALSERYLLNLKQAGLKIANPLALQLIPAEAFVAFRKGDTSISSSAEATQKVSAAEKSLLLSHLRSCAQTLGHDPDFVERFASVLV